jgi:hypothetical protein
MSIEVESDLQVKFVRRAAAGLLGLATLTGSLCSLVGCSSSERDRYYSSRSVVIPAQAGDGSTTLAAWPYGQTSPPAATARAGSMVDVGP